MVDHKKHEHCLRLFCQLKQSDCLIPLTLSFATLHALYCVLKYLTINELSSAFCYLVHTVLLNYAVVYVHLKAVDTIGNYSKYLLA